MVRCVLRAAQALQCCDAAGLGEENTAPWGRNTHGPQPHSSSSSASLHALPPSEGYASAAARSNCRSWGSQRGSAPTAQSLPFSTCPAAAPTDAGDAIPHDAAQSQCTSGGWWSRWYPGAGGAHSHLASQAWAARDNTNTNTTTSAAKTHSPNRGSSTLCAGDAAPGARCAAAATPAEWSFSSVCSSRRRPLLLASLTTSSLAASAAPAGPGPTSSSTSPPANTQHAPGASSAAAAGGAGQGAGGGPSRAAAVAGGGGGGGGAPMGRPPGASIGPLSGFTLPQVSIASPPGPLSYQADQDLAQELVGYHTAKHGGFPRPCLLCGSSEFLTPAAPSQQEGKSGRQKQQQEEQQQPEQEGEVVAWASRPLRCDGCQSWLHFGCAGVRRAEQVPPAPWFHCSSCRNQYLRLEAFAERNPHPSFNGSPAHALYVLTPGDDVRQRAGRGARGPMSAVRGLLLQGFEVDAVAGFGDPSREYDGGRYAAVLVHQGTPVSTATFNVFGPIAQLNMIATAVPHRQKGHASVLLSDVESVLAGCGVERVLVQPRGSDLGLWGGRWGYRALLPEEAVERHKEVPVAYYDCGILEKELGQLVGKGAAGGAEGVGKGQRAAQRLVSR